MARWIIVSNRLPFSLDARTNKLKQSSGGLVTAINGIKTKNPIHWVGSIAANIKKDQIEQYQKSSPYSFSYPKISESLYDSYYNNFCNDVLWPMLHYEKEIIQYQSEYFEDYKKVNRLFADHIAKIAKKGDIIWVNDFHLFLLPKYLKEKRKDLKVGFFLHVPFPSSEVYRELPCRSEILESLLYADLIGFHDFAYLRHFSSSVYNILGYDASLLDIITPHKKVRLGVFPVSIDTQDFIKKSKTKSTLNKIKDFNFPKEMKTILGVDRLDYTKGIPLKLQAFKKFLEDNPKYQGKVQLIQIAVPSRTEVPEYIKLRHEVERLVSEINGKYSKINYTPVKYIFNSVSVAELMALYKSSDLLFVASKRDGMNLVCLEYIVTQDEKNPGVVLLSEFAGAAQTLSHALFINPMDIVGTSHKIKVGLEMKVHERLERHNVMKDYLKHYTASIWAESFINQLTSREKSDINKKINLSIETEQAKLKKKVKNKTLLFLDFDGTLAPIQNNPSAVKLDAKTKKLLQKMTQNPKYEIVLVTGRDRKFISQAMQGIPCYLACEHGASFFDYQKKKWRNLTASKRKPWVKDALEIMGLYQKRVPQSFVEKKQYALCWHYRRSPESFAKLQARHLYSDLIDGMKNYPVTVSSGKKIVEVKSLEANKGYFCEWFLERYAKDHVETFAIGDDKTDEDMFKVLNKRAHTIKVGSNTDSYADYYLEDQADVFGLLNKLFS